MHHPGVIFHCTRIVLGTTWMEERPLGLSCDTAWSERSARTENWRCYNFSQLSHRHSTFDGAVGSETRSKPDVIV